MKIPGVEIFPWLQLASDAMISLAFFLVAACAWTVVRRSHLPFPRMFLVFGVCMAACGMGHFFQFLHNWNASLWAAVLAESVTAVSAFGAALFLYPNMSKILIAAEGLHLSETRRRMLEDYSDELRAVNALREREARQFEAIVASSSDQIYRLGTDGKFEYISPAVTKFFRMQKAELLGKGWTELGLNEETRQQLDVYFRDVLHGGREGRGSLSALSLEGIRHFDFLCSPIYEGGDVIAVTFNFRDVTEKRVFETELVKAYSEMEKRVRQRTEELSVSQKKFQDLVNTIDGIVWEAEVGMPGFSFVSSQAERITGFPMKRWLSESRFWQKILHPDDLAKITGDLYLYPEKKRDRQTEYRILTTDGRVLWMRDHIKVIYEEGRPSKMRGIMMDVSAQKLIEEALQKEKEISQHAASVKSDFLANMSHEIRTPLNAIVGMSSLALEGSLDEDTRDCLGTVKTAADSLLILVNDILDFSKIEAGGVKLEISDFRLNSLLRNATDVIQPLAKAKNIQLDCRPGEHIQAAVRGDPGRLQQILLNLLSNAVKFTPKGGVVNLVVEGTSPNFRFSVKDNGIGIDEASQKNLFQPFSQADSSTARKFGGTGLGLSICRRLVELMGGRIGLQSKPGEGSTFWFEITLPPARSKLDTFVEEESVSTSTKQSRSLRLLVADDNPANQKVITRLLEKLGHIPEVVANGADALAAFCERNFDLVLMDCQMPEMDGYEATRRIRKLEAEHGKRTPVIALTAHALEGESEKCRQAGMDDYLSKPVTLVQLGRTLEKWAKRSLIAVPKSEAQIKVSALDRAFLKTLEELNAPGKPDIIQELAAIFLETVPKRLALIREAMGQCDLVAARREAHSLKSTCHNVGATKAAAVCGEIEGLAEKGEEALFRERSELLFRRLERECRNAREELERWLPQRVAA